jgi:hypothetical protein
VPSSDESGAEGVEEFARALLAAGRSVAAVEEDLVR